MMTIIHGKWYAVQLYIHHAPERTMPARGFVYEERQPDVLSVSLRKCVERTASQTR